MRPALFSEETMSNERSKKIKSVIRVASGNFLEMYDFMVYGYYAKAIAAAFFPSKSEFASLMAALATFGAGFDPTVQETLAALTFPVTASVARALKVNRPEPSVLPPVTTPVQSTAWPSASVAVQVGLTVVPYA